MGRRCLPAGIALLAALTAAAQPSPTGLVARQAYLWAALDGWSLDRGLAVAMLADPLSEARAQAATVLASAADPRDLPLLGRYAADADPLVRSRAMLAAGRMGRPGLALAQQGLGDTSAPVRQAAAWAACHGGPAAWEALAGLLAREEDRGVLETALANLWRLEAAPWIAAAARFAAHDDPLLRRAAAYSLARTDDAAARAAQRHLAADAEPVIRATALRGLGRGSLEAPDRTLVLAALSDPDWRVQAAACSALAAQPPVEPSPEASAALESAFSSEQPQLAAAALAAAAGQPALGASLRLEEITAGGEPWLAALALQALAARGHEPAAATAAAWAASEDSWRRLAAARAARHLGAEAEARAASDRDPAVRLAWLESLDSEEAAPRRERLLQLVAADRDPAVRAQVLALLRGAGEAPDPDELLALAAGWKDDAMPDARAEALLGAWTAGEAPHREAAAAAAFSDRDPAVAAMLVNGVRAAGGQPSLPPREPRHGGVWYRELAEWISEPRWLDVVTERGSFRIRLDLESAPLSARELWTLAGDGFYDGLGFHRVVPNFVVQGGDPRGDGWGGPGWVLPDEPSLVPFDSWRVGIATSGPQTGGCQLFVTLLPADHLTGHYTNLGEVVAGRDVVTELRVGDRILEVRAVSGAAPVPLAAAPAGPTPAPAGG